MTAPWMSADRDDLSVILGAERPVRKCMAAGFTVDVGDAFPMWAPDMATVRRILAERDLIAAEVTA